MGIIAGFMVPHPPLIIPEVGRGGEKKIALTTESYDAVAREIADIAPETIIISSPHSVMYSDYFHISPGRRAKGDMSAFSAKQVRFEEEYDEELVREISRLADLNSFPAGTSGERDSSLDHGTMVPLYFIEKYYRRFKLVRIGLSGLPLSMNYRMGQFIAAAIENLGRKAVYVASGDLSHKLKKDGPYGFAAEGVEYDKRIMEVCGAGDFGRLFEFDERFCNKAAECGHRSFVMMTGALDGKAVDAKMYSHEDVTGVGYGICSFYVKGDDLNRKFLESHIQGVKKELDEKRERSDAYVRLARAAVDEYIKTGRRIEVPEGLPSEMLEKRAGTFVSIHEQGALRGCIGTIAPTAKNIAEEIIDNAMKASTEDPRFDPIEEPELEWLDISVDVLGEAERVTSKAELDVKRYGVIVTSGFKRGLLLPDLDGVDTVEEQLDIAKRKAGIRDGERISVERFEVVRHL